MYQRSIVNLKAAFVDLDNVVSWYNYLGDDYTIRDVHLEQLLLLCVLGCALPVPSNMFCVCGAPTGQINENLATYIWVLNICLDFHVFFRVC